jgi:hypothetical protein
MAKNFIRDPQVEKLKDIIHSEKREINFVTSRGLTVKLLAISPYMLELAASSSDFPKTPTYTVIIAGGGEETHDYDEISITDPKTPIADQERWLEFLDEVDVANRKASETLLNIILLESVQLDVSEKELTSWRKKSKMMGIVLPEDEEEQLLVYKKMYVTGNEDDITGITTAVLNLSTVSRKEIDLAKKSFPSSVESGAQSGTRKNS